jgi:hypothetical protein
MICDNCGSRIKDNSKSCINCGASVGERTPIPAYHEEESFLKKHIKAVLICINLSFVLILVLVGVGSYAQGNAVLTAEINKAAQTTTAPPETKAVPREEDVYSPGELTDVVWYPYDIMTGEPMKGEVSYIFSDDVCIIRDGGVSKSFKYGGIYGGMKEAVFLFFDNDEEYTELTLLPNTVGFTDPKNYKGYVFLNKETETEINLDYAFLVSASFLNSKETFAMVFYTSGGALMRDEFMSFTYSVKSSNGDTGVENLLFIEAKSEDFECKIDRNSGYIVFNESERLYPELYDE